MRRANPCNDVKLEAIVRRKFERHRAVQQMKCTRVAFGVEREHSWHGAECKVLGVELRVLLAERTVDLGRAKGRMQRSRDPGRQLLVESGNAERCFRPVRPQMP